MMDCRTAALKIIYDTFENDSFLNIAYKNLTEKEGYKGRDASFIKELSFGTVKHKITIDHIIFQFVNNKKKISPYILNILRLGVYQLFFTDKIPQSAAVNESVKLAAKFGKGAEKGFVNAVLRNILRGKINMPIKTDKDYLSVTYSFTPSMTGALKKAYGADFAEEIMKASNEPAEISVRVNSLKTNRDELISLLNEKGIEAEKSEKTPHGIKILTGANLQNTSLYKNGYFTVQDTASQLAALELYPKKGECVLDLCASPGGKTTYMAELMENEGVIYAYDLYEKRINSVKEAAERLGLSIIKCEARNSTEVMEEFLGKADKVLLDAPCSGWGVIRRKPDIKYKSENTDYKELTLVQKELIRTASKYLKRGAELLYSTCTLNKGENEKIVEGFLNENEDFELISMKTYFPNTDGFDGFFVSKIRRKTEE